MGCFGDYYKLANMHALLLTMLLILKESTNQYSIYETLAHSLIILGIRKKCAGEIVHKYSETFIEKLTPRFPCICSICFIHPFKHRWLIIDS